MRKHCLLAAILKLAQNNHVKADPSAPNSINQATVHVDGHYWLWNDDEHIMDLAMSAKGCRYEDLPTKYDFQSEHGAVEVPVNGQWNCTTKDIGDKGRKHTVKDMCNLVCDPGFGLRMKHLSDDQGEPNDPKWRMKSKRVVCKQGQWVPAAQSEEYPRCHNLCGELSLTDESQPDDAKAVLACMNLGSIDEDFCTPGLNCHHGATCYATCEDGFETENKPKESNEIQCKCTEKKCGWKIPEDIGTLGRCQFSMTSNNQRIIGGLNSAKDSVFNKFQMTLGSIISSTRNPYTRKKREAGESLIDHRRTKRQAQNGGLKWQHICGGVVLTAQWGFTAAHCRTVGLRVILGEVDFTDRSGSEVPCRVKAQIRHPEYNGQTYHDIMMIHMQCKKLRMGHFVWPAKLPRPNALMPIGNECTICGWGTMSYPHFAAATTLQCIDLPIMERSVCNVPYNGAIHDSIICMGELGVSGQDSCQGDSGSGAFCNGVCYGLVMGGLYCADEDYPGVYTVLSHYVGWAVTVIRHYISKQRGGGRRRTRRSLITPKDLRNLHLPKHQLKNFIH